MNAGRLKSIRKAAGYSQKSLADCLGVAPSTVSMWELGERDPDTTMLSKLCNFFKCTSDYLLGRTKRPNDYILDSKFLPPNLQSSDFSIIIREIVESGLSAKEIKRALDAHKTLSMLYEDKNNTDR